MHSHMQNLNKDDRERKFGSAFWHGRAWLYPTQRNTFRVEWCFGRHAISTRVEVSAGRGYDDVPAIGASIGLWHIVMLYLSLEFPHNKRLDHPEKELSIYLSDGFLHWSVWVDPDAAGMRNWRYQGVFIEDLLKGRWKYSEVELEKANVLIPMPEGSYPAEITLVESIWTFPRWPWPRKIRRAHVEISKGVPVPGKGENSWDLEDDAILGMTTTASTVEEAIAAIIRSAMRDRRRYGGSTSWQPEGIVSGGMR